MNLIKAGAGTAITQVTEAADHVTITIPAGKGGALKAIGLQVLPVLETVVDSGGLVTVRNSSADWTPLELLTATGSVVTESGNSVFAPMVYEINKLLPGNSSVYFNYTPYDNQSQCLKAFLIWEQGVTPAKETFVKTKFVKKADAVSATARASPGIIVIPGAKGGQAKALAALPFGTLETVVSSGGLVEFELDAFDITPCQFYSTEAQAVGASGGGTTYPQIIPYIAPVPENSTYTVYYTPFDDQSQTLATSVIWERPYGTKRV